MSAIYVMWIRQVKKQWRSKSRLIGSLGQPLLFLLALGFGFGAIYQKAGGGNYITFLSAGIIAMSIMFTAVFSGIEVIWDRRFGFLKETLVAPVSRFSIMFGRTLGGATISIFQGIFVLIITFFVGFRPVSFFGILISLLFMLLIGLFFAAFGTAIASIVEDMQAFPIIMNFVIMPLFFLSGALFPIESSPKTLQIIAYFNPLTYGVDGLRDTLTGISSIGFGIDLIVMSLSCIVVIWIGSYLFSKIEV